MIPRVQKQRLATKNELWVSKTPLTQADSPSFVGMGQATKEPEKNI